ncbi:MAG: hypothetical protein HZB26_23665 [Candidatus Hydrogenedentes bacterium]|nr:hypothetical protein [Candidatus Hydrogenedentota bacterium]
MTVFKRACRLKYSALMSVCALLCLAIALPYLRDKYGPIQVWLSPWERKFAITPIGRPASILMTPHGKPGVIVICAEGELRGTADLRLNSRQAISLPVGLNQVYTFDWYEGPCQLEYVPGSAVSGRLTVKWKFG